MTPQPLKQTPEKNDDGCVSPASVRRLFDPSEILSYLDKERGYSAAAIAHLEPELFDVSQWFVAAGHMDSALCLMARSTSPTYLFTLGTVPAINCILDRVNLPRHVFITCHPHHLDVIKGHYNIGWNRVTKRMMVTSTTFVPAPGEAIRLRSAHLKELNRLYRSHDNRSLSVDHIRKGVYYGVWSEGKLAAAAGTHIIAPSYGIAYVGNVLTDSAHRNRGFATLCTSAVTADLLDYCTEVVLNVDPQNLPAIQAYSNLGYRFDCMVIEAFGRRQSMVGVIIANLWRGFRASEKQQEGVKVDG